jgi:hypothetical protein
MGHSATSTSRRLRAPLNDSIVVAIARLVEDAQSQTREPSHSDLDFEFERAGLSACDPRFQGQTVGKAKRVRAVLNWALENAPDQGEALVAGLIATIRGMGGFRPGSTNFVGEDAITDAANAFSSEGYVLSREGDLHPTNLDTLQGANLTKALETYVRRAQRGSEDAALIVGTGKDLLEATAAHIISERYGGYSPTANFPTLLGQAFTALSLATLQTPASSGEPPQRRLERAMYEAGCAANAFRNKQGTGHGRPWLATVTEFEARAAIQTIGVVAGFLLAVHKSRP